MEQLRTLGLIDSDGKPIAAHIDGALTLLVARLRRQFPATRDDVTLVEVMEEAGRKLVRREARGGPIERLHEYAWTAVKHAAISRMRRGSLRLVQKTLDSHVSEALLRATPAECGSPEEIERGILMRQILAKLSDDELELFLSKLNGHSSQVIARRTGSSVSAVDTVFSRTKDKLRGMVSSTPRVVKIEP
jgi:DNA-directed RNA polymerase specialized sigma24 family protein